MHALLRSKITWTFAGAALLVGLYALLGFYAAPRLVRSQAIEHVRATYDRELTLGEVRLHPFKLQAEVRDLSLPDADGTPMLAFRRLFVDFQFSSLWQRAFVFREVALDAPRVRAVIHKDGSLNLADLVPPEDEDEADDGPLPAVWIQSFGLTDGTIDLLNNLRRRPVERHFSPVTFVAAGFPHDAEGGGFGLTAPAGRTRRSMEGTLRAPAADRLDRRVHDHGLARAGHRRIRR